MASPPRLVKTRPAPASRARGLVSSRESGKRIHAQSFEPADELACIVERFWVGAWDLPAEEPHVTKLLGDPCVHIVFEDGDCGPDARIVGVWTRLWERKLSGSGRVRGVKFHPGAASAVLGRPIQKWTDSITPLSSQFPNEADQLRDAVLRPQEDREGLEGLAEFIAKRARLSTDGLLVRNMVEAVRTNSSLTRVETLAEQFELGIRAIQRLFREHVGATPKWWIVRNRLQEVAARIESGDVVSLAALAADLGYTDQAHLTRDFQSVVGKTPSAFARECEGNR